MVERIRNCVFSRLLCAFWIGLARPEVNLHVLFRERRPAAAQGGHADSGTRQRERSDDARFSRNEKTAQRAMNAFVNRLQEVVGHRPPPALGTQRTSDLMGTGPLGAAPMAGGQARRRRSLAEMIGVLNTSAEKSSWRVISSFSCF